MKQVNNITHCPNCESKLGQSFLDKTHLVKEETTTFINTFTDKNEAGYCSKCVVENKRKAQRNYVSMRKEVNTALSEYLIEIPVLTIEVLPNWDYQIIDLVSLSKSVNPFGEKRKAGEKACIQSIRKKAFDLGGNAVIGTSITYSLGDSSGSLYGVMNVYGTAIKVQNVEVLADSFHTARENYLKYLDLEKLILKYDSFR